MTELDSRKRRWLDFYRMDGRTSFLLMASWGRGLLPQPRLWYELKRERVGWAYASWQRAMEDMLSVPDDAVPYLNMLTGTEIFAEAMGCRVHYPEDSNPFALPCVHSAKEALRLPVPRWQDTRLSILFEMADGLIGLAGPGAVFRLPDVQSPLDVAALVWDKNTFYTALIEEPDAVLELAGKCKQLLFSFLDAWFDRYGTSFVAHFPEYYMQGGATLSEDEIGAISPAMFCRFVLPSLAEISLRYGGLGVHSCACSEHQWENMKQIPGLKLLNLNRPIASQRESWKQFLGHAALYPSPCGEGPDCCSWPSQYPPGSHAVLTIEAKDRMDAREKVLRMRDVLSSIRHPD